MKEKLFKEVLGVVAVVTFMSFSKVWLRPVKRYYSEYPVTTAIIFFGLILGVYAIVTLIRKKTIKK